MPIAATGTDEQAYTVVSAVAFGDIAEKIAKLGKGDAVSVVGSLKPSTWQDKATNETKHGLDMTVSQSLSVYDIKKRRPKDEQASTGKPPQRPQSAHHAAKANGYQPDLSTMPDYPEFNDALTF